MLYLRKCTLGYRFFLRPVGGNWIYQKTFVNDHYLLTHDFTKIMSCNMTILTNILVAFVAALHIWFLVLEMFLWQKPIGRRIFRTTPAQAEMSAVLAANQGLYNGFLAAGLITSLFFSDATQMHSFQVFFLSCVIVAGLYGAYSVNRRIFVVQAFPALITLALVCMKV